MIPKKSSKPPLRPPLFMGVNSIRSPEPIKFTGFRVKAGMIKKGKYVLFAKQSKPTWAKLSKTVKPEKNLYLFLTK
jgi:hypothetical protein